LNNRLDDFGLIIYWREFNRVFDYQIDFDEASRLIACGACAGINLRCVR
jgi:hypothetical protein